MFIINLILIIKQVNLCLISILTYNYRRLKKIDVNKLHKALIVRHSGNRNYKLIREREMIKCGYFIN